MLVLFCDVPIYCSGQQLMSRGHRYCSIFYPYANTWYQSLLLELHMAYRLLLQIGRKVDLKQSILITCSILQAIWS